MYLKYDEYTAMGGTMDAALFPRFEMKARMLIDMLTRRRLEGEDPVRESVKYCMYELIQMMHGDEASGCGGREITGVSNDGVSISYAAGQSSTGGGMQRYVNYIRTWLSGETTAEGVSVLYAGVDA